MLFEKYFCGIGIPVQYSAFKIKIDLTYLNVPKLREHRWGQTGNPVETQVDHFELRQTEECQIVNVTDVVLRQIHLQNMTHTAERPVFYFGDVVVVQPYVVQFWYVRESEEFDGLYSVLFQVYVTQRWQIGYGVGVQVLNLVSGQLQDLDERVR